MMTITNGLIALLCAAAATHEVPTSLPIALAYAGFGIGYVGLAWLYVGP